MRDVLGDALAPVRLSVVGQCNGPGDSRLSRTKRLYGFDFSSFLEAVPGYFFFVGTRNEARGLTWGHHHSRFDIDEAALPTAVELMVAVTERYLSG
jgi:amidohydrolase